MNSTIERFVPLSGVAFAVLLVAGVSLAGGAPAIDATAAEMVEYTADNGATLRLSALVLATSMFALLLFVGCLRSAARDRDSHPALTAALAGGGVIAAAGIGVDAGLRFTLAESVDDIGPEALQAVYAIWSGYFWTIHVGFALLILAACLGALATRSGPSWLAGVGIIGSLLLVIPVVAATLIGLIVGGVWVIATSVLLYRQAPAAS
jgi:hypothetical protein